MSFEEGNKDIEGALEALLFIYGEPITPAALAKILQEDEETARAGLDALDAQLMHDGRGLALLRNAGKVQLITKPEFSHLLKTIVEQEFIEPLTPAALETLSLVAYAGPISRAQIEFIRGVNSSFMLRMLLVRGLVEREPDPKRPNAYLYRSSGALLRHLGLSANTAFPDYQKYQGLIERLQTELTKKE